MHSNPNEITSPGQDKEIHWSAIRMLLGYLRPFQGRIILSVILMLLVTGFELLLPYLLKVALDEYILPGRWQAGLWIFPTYFFGLMGLTLSTYFNTYWMDLNAQFVMRDVRVNLFRHLLHLPLGYFYRQPTGKLVTRVTHDVDALQELLSQGVVAIMADLFVSVAILMALFKLSPILTGVVLTCAPLVVYLSAVFHRRARNAQDEIRTWLARLNSFLQEQVSGMHLVQLYRAEQDSYTTMEKLNRGYGKANVRAVVHYAWYYPAIRSVEILSTLLTLFVGGYLFHQGRVTLGIIVAFFQYINRFFEPLADLSDKYNIIVQASVAAERIHRAFQESRDPLEKGPDLDQWISPELQIRGLTYRYNENQPWVLKNVDLDFHAGSRYAIAGMTGAGKSTLMSLLLHFYKPESGVIRLNGHLSSEYNAPSIRRHIGVAFQEPFLFSTSIRDNILLGRNHGLKCKLDKLLETWGENPLIRTFAARLDEEVSERGRNLSQSEKQLVTLLRAVVHDPEVLILDEAMSALDAESEHQLHELIREAMKNRTVIIIGHRLSTLPDVDQVIMLHDGEIIERGTPNDLLARDSVFAALIKLHLMEPVS